MSKRKRTESTHKRPALGVKLVRTLRGHTGFIGRVT